MKIELGPLSLMDIIGSIRMPSLVIDSKRNWHAGDEMKIGVKGCLFPVIDPVKGRIRYPRDSPPNKIPVSFSGTGGPVIEWADFDPEQKTLSLVVPTAARSGPVMILMPVAESGISPAGHGSAASVKTSDEDRRRVAIPLLTTSIRVTCQKCLAPETSLCPYGNIKFDADGYCYVDQDSCRGQDQSGAICWECFPPDTASTSSSFCTYLVLRKTAYISRVGDAWCCGCCAPQMQRIPGRCLKDLCAFEAITGGSSLCDRCPYQTGGVSPSEVDDYGYWIDKDACTGCRICFDNIACSKVHMKAYIGPAAIGVEILTFRLKLPFRRIPPEAIRERIRLGIWHGTGRGFQWTELPVRYSGRLQHLDVKFSSERELHLGLFARRKDGSLISLGFDARAGVRTVGGGPRPQSEIIRLNTILGSCEVTVSYSSGKPPAGKSRAGDGADLSCR